jgi:hypothetical protein
LQVLPWIERERRKGEADPNYRKNFVTISGEEWKESRRILDQRFLAPNQVAKYTAKYVLINSMLNGSRIDGVASDMVSIMIKRFQKHGTVTELEKLFYMFATEAIGTVVFDSRIGVLGEH